MTTNIRKLALASSIALSFGIAESSLADDRYPQDTQQVTDARHEMQILTGFSTNRQLRPFDLTVRVAGNKATLGGSVEDGVSKDLAGSIASAVDGIQSVENRIIVEAAIAPSMRAANDPAFGEKLIRGVPKVEAPK